MTRLGSDRLSRAIPGRLDCWFPDWDSDARSRSDRRGIDTYGEFSAGLRVFWVSLTILHPLTVLLLLFRKRAGVVVALVVILADIAVNWTVFLTIGGNPLFGVVNQTMFAVFLLITTPTLWRSFRIDPA